MSYIVTARKWRPQTFGDVIGQQHVTDTLKSAIRSGRIGHAYLFSGPRGVGKTTVARIFAKALNCEKGPAEEPCNECPVCLGIQSGVSLDIQEIDGASNNSVEDVRNLIGNIGYHSTECRYKMYIVDEVHMLSKAAFNALLKTLEEPPPNVIFVFATTEPQKIPPTILSRCQRYDFHRLSAREIAGKLARIAATENIAIDEGAMLLVAGRAGGAMRDAESILEQLKASRGDGITVQDVTEVLGIADREVFFGILDRCHENDPRGAVELFAGYYDRGGDLKEFAEGLLEHLRDLLYASLGSSLDHVILADDMKARLREQASWYGRHDLVRMIGYVTEAESALAYAVLPVLRIETALARMALLDRTIELRELLDRLGGVEPEPARPGGSAGSASPETRAESGARQGRSSGKDAPPDAGIGRDEFDGDEDGALMVDPEIGAIRANWNAIVHRIAGTKPAVGPSLQRGEPESFEAGRLSLRFAGGDGFHRKAVDANAAVVADMLGDILGVQVTVVTILDDGGDEKKNSGSSELDDLIRREPAMGDIMDLFDGEFNGIWRD